MTLCTVSFMLSFAFFNCAAEYRYVIVLTIIMLSGRYAECRLAKYRGTKGKDRCLY
jgi:hypothetical protein